MARSLETALENVVPLAGSAALPPIYLIFGLQELQLQTSRSLSNAPELDGPLRVPFGPRGRRRNSIDRWAHLLLVLHVTEFCVSLSEMQLLLRNRKTAQNRFSLALAL